MHPFMFHTLISSFQSLHSVGENTESSHEVSQNGHTHTHTSSFTIVMFGTWQGPEPVAELTMRSL